MYKERGQKTKREGGGQINTDVNKYRRNIFKRIGEAAGADYYSCALSLKITLAYEK
jgi:hypothetical protein